MTRDVRASVPPITAPPHRIVTSEVIAQIEPVRPIKHNARTMFDQGDPGRQRTSENGSRCDAHGFQPERAMRNPCSSRAIEKRAG